MRKLLSLGLVALVGSSCATVKPQIKPVSVPKETLNVQSGKTAQEVIKATPLVLKADDLGIPPDEFLTVSFSGGSLRDFCEYLNGNGYTCKADKEVENRRVLPIYGRYSLKELLKKVGEETDSYGSWENGVIRFRLTKTVVYQIPLLSREYKRLLFKTSDEDFLSEVKEDIFGELQREISELLKSYSLSIENTERTSYKEEISRLKEVQKKDKENSKKGSSSLKEKEDSHQKSSSVGKSSTESKNSNKETEKEKQIKVGNKKGLRRKGEKSFQGISPYSKDYQAQKFKQEYAGAKNKSYEFSSLSKENENRKTASEKLIAKLVENSLKNGINYLSTTEGQVLVKKTLEEKKPLAVSSQTGLVVAVVNREQEKLLDAYFNQLKKQLESMVAMKIYIIELSSKDAKRLTTTLNLLKRAYRHQFTADVGVDSAQIEFTNLSTDYLSGIAHGIDASFIVGYLKDKLNAKVVSSTELLSLSREMARLKNAVGYPYLEPKNVSVGGTNPTLSYSIKYVYDGFDLKMIPTVLGDRIFLQVGFEQTQYLGDKIIQAGQLGNIQVPIKAPKTVNTSFMCRSGDVVFVGGLKKYEKRKENASNLGVPTNNINEEKYKEVLILIEPRLIKFTTRIR